MLNLWVSFKNGIFHGKLIFSLTKYGFLRKNIFVCSKIISCFKRSKIEKKNVIFSFDKNNWNSQEMRIEESELLAVSKWIGGLHVYYLHHVNIENVNCMNGHRFSKSKVFILNKRALTFSYIFLSVSWMFPSFFASLNVFSSFCSGIFRYSVLLQFSWYYLSLLKLCIFLKYLNNSDKNRSQFNKTEMCLNPRWNLDTKSFK